MRGGAGCLVRGLGTGSGGYGQQEAAVAQPTSLGGFKPRDGRILALAALDALESGAAEGRVNGYREGLVLGGGGARRRRVEAIKEADLAAEAGLHTVEGRMEPWLGRGWGGGGPGRVGHGKVLAPCRAQRTACGPATELD